MIKELTKHNCFYRFQSRWRLCSVLSNWQTHYIVGNQGKYLLPLTRPPAVWRRTSVIRARGDSICHTRLRLIQCHTCIINPTNYKPGPTLLGFGDQLLHCFTLFILNLCVHPTHPHRFSDNEGRRRLWIGDKVEALGDPERRGQTSVHRPSLGHIWRKKITW
jgi:hypothetical protein